MYLYNTKKEDKKTSKNCSETQNPSIPKIKPSDIIEKSTRISGDWLTRGINKNAKGERDEHNDNNNS